MSWNNAPDYAPKGWGDMIGDCARRLIHLVALLAVSDIRLGMPTGRIRLSYWHET
ncbi:MAG: hypothetical protein ABNH53_07490 [Henriciella sp.]